ncbi:MAG TPA: branched-chain amino acid ABC transporter permease [Acetobacteraceae bacterium]|nr:branched-chain amino acid ABC transporter permease [Acetobacteraceae bacterium]
MAVDSPVAQLIRADRLRPIELLPWVVAVAAYFLASGYLPLGSQIMIMILFALSLDLVLGYAGIVTLGQAAFFGVGAYAAGIYAVHVSGEPLSGLLVGAAAAAIVGAVSGAIILRTGGLTLLMLTLAITSLLEAAANDATPLTGGNDGLQGVAINPLLGLFDFDLYGRTAYLYCLVVLFIAWLFVRRLVHAPFGQSLVGIRENVVRMHAIGTPVRRRLLTAYTVSAALAGIAGALLTQTTQFVGLTVLSFERSGEIVIMLVLGGTGRIYGAFIGAAVYMIAQDQLAEADPVFWDFWIGLLLVLIVLFARGGILGLTDRLLLMMPRRR